MKSRKFACKDCGLRMVKCGNYMVWNHLWKEAGNIQGCLCIPCLENRLGRILLPSDFSYVPLNLFVYRGIYKTPDILKERMLGFEKEWFKYQMTYSTHTNNKVVSCD